MSFVYRVIRFPVYLLAAIVLTALLPILVVAAISTLAVRLLLLPFVVIGTAFSSDHSRLRDYIETTKGFPWSGEYAVKWHHLNRWLLDGPGGT